MTVPIWRRELRADWDPATVGDDVMTVHKVRDGKALCGAAGEVTEWIRRVTCEPCEGLS